MKKVLYSIKNRETPEKPEPPKKKSRFESVIISINEFLGNILKFLSILAYKIDVYKIDRDHQEFFDTDFIDDENANSILTTLMFLGRIIFNIFIIALMIVLNMMQFIVSNFIAPYVGKTIMYTIRILALITAIILVYYILVKFNKVNTFIDKDYVNFFIKTFQKVVKN